MTCSTASSPELALTCYNPLRFDMLKQESVQTGNTPVIFYYQALGGTTADIDLGIVDPAIPSNGVSNDLRGFFKTITDLWLPNPVSDDSWDVDLSQPDIKVKARSYSASDNTSIQEYVDDLNHDIWDLMGWKGIHGGGFDESDPKRLYPTPEDLAVNPKLLSGGLLLQQIQEAQREAQNYIYVPIYGIDSPSYEGGYGWQNGFDPDVTLNDGSRVNLREQVSKLSDSMFGGNQFLYPQSNYYIEYVDNDGEGLSNSNIFTLVHEIGLALGLTHPEGIDGYEPGWDTSMTVMSYHKHIGSNNIGVYPSDFTDLDKRALSRLWDFEYSPDPDSPSPNNKTLPSKNRPPERILDQNGLEIKRPHSKIDSIMPGHKFKIYNDEFLRGLRDPEGEPLKIVDVSFKKGQYSNSAIEHVDKGKIKMKYDHILYRPSGVSVDPVTLYYKVADSALNVIEQEHVIEFDNGVERTGLVPFFGTRHHDNGRRRPRIRGTRGDDQLFGFKGNDRIIGGPGNDFIDPGLYKYQKRKAKANKNRNHDFVSGGRGRDSFYVDVDYKVQINDFQEGVDRLYVTSALGDLTWRKGGKNRQWNKLIADGKKIATIRVKQCEDRGEDNDLTKCGDFNLSDLFRV